MKAFCLFCGVIVVVIACQRTKQDAKEEGKLEKVTTTLSSDTKSETESIKKPGQTLVLPKHPDFDSLKYFLESGESMSTSFYRKLADYERANEEKAFVKSVKKVKDNYRILVDFHTWHSDSPEKIVELVVLDSIFNRKTVIAIEYEAQWDLFSCSYRILEDGSILVTENQYINYDQDTLNITTRRIQINEFGILDTIKIDSTQRIF